MLVQSRCDLIPSPGVPRNGKFVSCKQGKLRDGQEVAVKRMARASGQGVREFKNEVKLIAKLQHTNLVRLFGCCLEKGEKLLVYEYMSNRSLDYFLKEKLKYNVEADGDVENTTEEADHDLPHISLWAIQDATNNFSEANKLGEGGFGPVYKCIVGLGKVIQYNHGNCKGILGSTVHRDLKAGNILLDEQMNPKISDFGMARTFTGVHGQATTSTVVGTYFGILLLEIICGQLNSEFQLSHPDQNLIMNPEISDFRMARIFTGVHGQAATSVAWRFWSEGNVSEFIDPILRSTSSINEVERCMHMGLLCIQEDAATRPTMSAVVLMLGNSSLALPVPKAPAYSQIISTSAQSNPQLSSLLIASPTPR
ncbi:Cysteine-rich receptor-like protein kinase 10 [Nymphaea thermarum]|nr:Cysteine-rich receptor-like protein kinase 10 [Nymphaea thermarum]